MQLDKKFSKTNRVYDQIQTKSHFQNEPIHHLLCRSKIHSVTSCAGFELNLSFHDVSRLFSDKGDSAMVVYKNSQLSNKIYLNKKRISFHNALFVLAIALA